MEGLGLQKRRGVEGEGGGEEEGEQSWPESYCHLVSTQASAGNSAVHGAEYAHKNRSDY